MGKVSQITRSCLITRPHASAAELAELLESEHIPTFIASVMQQQPLSTIDAAFWETLRSSYDALILTSRYSLHMLHQAGGFASMPLYVTGALLAEDAKAKGFVHIEAAEGNARSLVKLMQQEACKERLNGCSVAWLHGVDIVVDLSQSLADESYQLDDYMLYECHKSDDVDALVLDALRQGQVGCVLHYSPLSARYFMELMRDHQTVPLLAHATALCMSDAIAAALDPIDWQAVHVAPSMQPHIVAAECKTILSS